MATTTTFTATPLSEIKDRLAEAIYDPTLLVQAKLETIEAITNGEGLLLDPTHPAIVLLEMASCEAANNIQETVGLLRKEYPALAETSEDLYRHMSDKDYLNRFATPSTTTMTLAVIVSDLMSKLIYDASEDTYKVIIPRDTRFTIDDVVFTLCYPIIIRRYPTNAIQINYDTEISSPIQSVSEVVITPKMRTSSTQEDWLFFDVDVVQVDYISTSFVLDLLYNFKKTISFTDSFYFARAFYRNTNTNNLWVELTTTHSDQVFNSSDPTVVFQVVDSDLIVRIPVIYLTSGTITGELRVDIYTTKGEIVMNLQNYSQDLFGVIPTPIDETRNSNDYVDALSNISYYVYSTAATSGGKAELAFEDFKNRVIYNAIGEQVIPITNVDLQATAQDASFDIVKNVDVVTNRIFLATRKLPKPTNAKLITPANIGIITIATDLSGLNNNANVIINTNRRTIKSNTLFINEDGTKRILNDQERAELASMGQTSLLSTVNSVDYYYTPFYMVLDNSSYEFDMRVYALDRPLAQDLSFVRLNQTLQLFVNTKTYSFEKTSTGYLLTIQTNSGNYFKSAEDNYVGVQLAFNPYGETTYAYINGELIGKTSENERIYTFKIETNHDLDSSDRIAITNANVQGISDYKAWIDLETTFSLIYHTSLTTANFVADETDTVLGKFMLNAGSVGNSLEKIKLIFGYALSSLWRRAHSYYNDFSYQTYPEDVPERYAVDTYELDPVTQLSFTIVNGEIVNNAVHLAGEIVMQDGEVVYAHRKGDVILDSMSNPVLNEAISYGREFDILVVDGRYYFADDDATVDYRSEIQDTLTEWITVGLSSLDAELLEKSELFFYPKSTVGEVTGYVGNGEEATISSAQSFSMTLYVTEAIYRDETIRSNIRTNTVKLLDSYIDQTSLNMTELRDSLKTLYGSSVKAFSITGFGDDGSYEMFTMKDTRYRLSLKKELTARADKKLYVSDGVTIEFSIAN